MGWWDDFANNLATDLGPLISLFGEEPTKQYLSETTLPEDYIIFGTAPIGILTAVVSAIRVCGSSSLRAFIGRAQEGEGNAEVELCSSTSRNVGELYNNGGIARTFGTPKLLEIIFDPEASKEEFYPSESKKSTAGIHLPKDYFNNLKEGSEWAETRRRKRKDRDEENPEKRHLEGFAPNPNLTLNVGIQERPRLLFLFAALVGVTLQCGVLVWAGFARYTFHFIQSKPTAEYAVPMTVIGTILVSLGVGLCAFLVDSSTGERRFKRKRNEYSTAYQSQMYWVQPGNQKIGDQAFDSFAFTNGTSRKEYITSWKKKPNGKEKKHIEVWVWFAVGSTMVGFILQFLGLRACHSSVSVAQLGVMLVMSIARAGLRTQRLEANQNLMNELSDIFKAHELDWLALHLGKDAETPRKWRIAHVGTDHYQEAVSSSDKNLKSLWIAKEHQLVGFRPTNTGKEDYSLNYTPEGWLKDFQSRREGSPPHDAVKIFLYRCRLARLTEKWTEDIVPVKRTAGSLAKAIEKTADIIFDSFKIKPEWEGANAIYWPIKCELLGHTTKSDDEPIEIFMSLKRDVDQNGSISGPWMIDKPELEAVLGLQLWELNERQRKENLAKGRPIPHENPKTRILWQIPENSASDVQSMDYDMWRESRQPKIQRVEVCPPWSRDESFARNEALPMHPLFGWQNISKKRQRSREIPLLALPTDLPLSKLCAQDLYSSFFMAALRLIERLSHPYWDTRSLKWDFISQIQQIFSDSSLGTPEDALICCVPALKIQKRMKTILHIAMSSQFQTPTSFLEPLKIPIDPDPKVSNRDRRSDRLKRQEVMENDSNKLKFVTQLLKNGFDPNLKDHSGRTALHWAAMESKPPMAKLLLENLADVNARDSKEFTPLSVAAFRGKEEMVELLLKNGANVKSKDKFGDTPLHDTLDGNREGSKTAKKIVEKIVTLLLEKGADPSSQNDDGVTPLHMAADFDRPDIIESMLRREVDLNLQNKSGDTPLHIAARNGTRECVEELLTQHSNLSLKNKSGDTSLHLAAKTKHAKIVEMLLDEDADPTKQNDSGDTPLHLAAKVGCIKSMNFLSKKEGADNTVKNYSGETPVDLAEKAGIEWIPCNAEDTAETPQSHGDDEFERSSGLSGDHDRWRPKLKSLPRRRVRRSSCARTTIGSSPRSLSLSSDDRNQEPTTKHRSQSPPRDQNQAEPSKPSKAWSDA